MGPVKANFLLIYCDVYVCLVWNSGPFEIVMFENVGEDSVICIICCIDSGIFWTGIFEMPEVYITVDYVDDRSLE